MSYEIVIGQTKLFGDNPIFKEFNPSVDITVDFRNRDIYEFLCIKFLQIIDGKLCLILLIFKLIIIFY